MIHRFLHSSCLLLLLALLLLTSTPLAHAFPSNASSTPPADAPDSQPPLPPGHPQLPDQPSSSTNTPPLPSGHPAIPAPDAPKAPPLHGDEFNFKPFLATLHIKATQGTKDAPAPANDEVVVEFFFGKKSQARATGKLDDSGSLTLSNIQLPGPVQPLISIIHQNVPYQTLSMPINGDNPTASISITVFQRTDSPPAWSIPLRHINLLRSTKGIIVQETLVISNPTDQTWAPMTPASSPDQPDQPATTITFPSAPGTTKIQPAQGFNPQLLTITKDQLISRMPLLPGHSRLQYAYIVPADEKGFTTLNLPTIAPTQKLAVLYPDDGSQIHTQGLTPDAPTTEQNQTILVFKAQNLFPSSPLQLHIGPPAPKKPQP